MMKSFRKLTGNIAFKIVLGIVALSFVFFGVSSFVLGNSSNWVAQIGGKKISYSTLQKAMKENRELILKSYGNNEQAMQYLESDQFTSDSLSRIVNQEMVKNLSSEYDIKASEKIVLENIAKDKNFADETGKFNQTKFKDFLKRSGINEDLYVNEIINQTSMLMIIQTMEIAAPVSSKKIIDIINFNEEKRMVDLVSINEKNVKNIESVSEKEVEKYYNDHKKEFSLPEFRKILLAKFTAKDLASAIEIKEQEIVAEYEKNKESYTTEETRDFYHVVFDEEKQAQEFIANLKKINQNDNKKIASQFASLAKEQAKKDLKTITLNQTNKKQLLTETVSKAFALKINELSSPIKSSLGYHVFLLNNINQSQTKSLAQVRDEIKNKLNEKKKDGALAKKISELDSELLSSSSIGESLNKSKINSPINQYNIDNSGKDPSGNAIFSQDNEIIVKNVFALKKNQNSKTITSQDGLTFYVLQVTDIIPSKTQELASVAKAIQQKLQNDKKEIALSALAHEVSAEISQNLNNLALVTNKYRLKLEKNRLMPRTYVINYQGQQFPYRSPLLDKIFSIELNQSTGAINDSGGYSIAILRDIKKPQINQQLVEEVAKSSQKLFRSDIMQQFNNYLMNKYPVKVNEKIFRKNQEN
ncbi:peptidylprolyl isomerase [Alphaproteobacteria bacterium]|nr:peptidylprolyl isomerase [Alphaproteobacteria bacterium]